MTGELSKVPKSCFWGTLAFFGCLSQNYQRFYGCIWIRINECFAANRVGHNEVIGVCHTGPDAEGLGRDHWNEMLAYPRKPITHWHALGEVQTFVYLHVQCFWEPLHCHINHSFFFFFFLLSFTFWSHQHGCQAFPKWFHLECCGAFKHP